MSRRKDTEDSPRYGPLFRGLWLIVAALSPLAVLWAISGGDPNDVLFTFGVVLASWSGLADSELELTDAMRGLTGVTLLIGVVAAALGLFVKPFGL